MQSLGHMVCFSSQPEIDGKVSIPLLRWNHTFAKIWLTSDTETGEGEGGIIGIELCDGKSQVVAWGLKQL